MVFIVMACVSCASVEDLSRPPSAREANHVPDAPSILPLALPTTAEIDEIDEIGVAILHEPEIDFIIAEVNKEPNDLPNFEWITYVDKAEPNINADDLALLLPVVVIQRTQLLWHGRTPSLPHRHVPFVVVCQQPPRLACRTVCLVIAFQRVNAARSGPCKRAHVAAGKVAHK